MVLLGFHNRDVVLYLFVREGIKPVLFFVVVVRETGKARLLYEETLRW